MSHQPIDPSDLVARYVALWNEPDPAARRKSISELWTSGGAHVLHSPPEQIRESAASLAFPAPALEIRGYEALDARVTHAHEQFVAAGSFTFKASGEPSRPLPNIVTFVWEMVPTAGGDTVGSGFEVLVLDEHGRITGDHQYIPI
jgi:hypothetical protein